MKKNKIFIIFYLFILTLNTSNAWVGLLAAQSDILTPIKWNEMFEETQTKINQDNITGTGNIEVNHSGTGVIISLTGSITGSPIPDIMTEELFIPTNTSGSISILGDDFIPDSMVTLPGFPGTINNISVVSQRQIDIDLSTGSFTGTYNVVISNKGQLNTLWIGNGVDIIVVTAGSGISQKHAGMTCISIYNNGYSTGDGNYWINPDGGDTSNAFNTFCDMP